MRATKLCGLGFEAIGRMANPRMSHVNIALTMRCNHKCQTCNQDGRTSHDEISERDIALLIEHNDLMWISLTGGEPSLAHEFGAILARCVQSVKLTNVITNGEFPILIEKSVKNALASNGGVLVVHISLLGSPRAHDSIVGVEGSFKRLDETIQRLKTIKSDRLIIGVEHTISGLNMFEYLWVSDYAKRNKIGLTYTIEQTAGFYGNSKVKIDKQGYPPISASFNIVDIFKNGYLRGKKVDCVAGQFSCFVMPNKHVYPCMFAVPDHPAFNLIDKGYNIGKQLEVNHFVNRCSGERRCLTPCETYSTFMFRPWRFIG